MTKVSIIMPVYNCEEYLAESLNSVLGQTLQEIEIICIDDGSTDNSGSILREYAERDSRIKFFTQTNQGAGSARNIGIKHAIGEYLAFLDADDYYMENDMLELMYQTSQKYGVNACGSNLRLLRNRTIAEDSGFQKVKQAAKEKEILHYREFQFDYGYCGFIIKTSIIKEYNILFPSYRRFQDPPFFVQAMYYADTFCFLEKALYCYRTPNVSMRFDSVRTADLLRGLISNLEFASVHHLNILFSNTKQRLEVEYNSVICSNILPESTEILELLIKANNIIRHIEKNDAYVAAPLKKILTSVIETEKYYKESICQRIFRSEKLYLYGAGQATFDFLNYLKKQGAFEKVQAIIVTDKEGNPEHIEEIPVISLDEYRYQNDDLILITVTSIYKKDIIENLMKRNLRNYESIDAAMLCTEQE